MHNKLQRQMAKILFASLGDGGNDDAGGTGGAGGEDITKTEAFQKALQERLDQETAGLKANRDEILGKYTSLKGKIKEYEGIDPEMARNLQKRFESEEEQELLKKGDLDAIVNRRVDKMKQNYEKQFAELSQKEQAAVKRQQALEQRAIAAEITRTAAEVGAIPSALPDFVQRANGQFALDDNGQVIAVDSQGNQLYDVDGKSPLSIKSWALSLQAEAPHLFSKPSPGGAKGGQGYHQAGNVAGSKEEREAYFSNKFKLPKK